ncbi:MAG: BMP family ABC transporter substrate-binding protein [Clostridia bacterium]|nr:BMP family ABC transporter substrate-binding protein [Clostridia bacterium]
MKRVLALVLAFAMALCLGACGSTKTEEPTAAPEGDSDIKVGFIFVGDENEGYTYAHYQGALAMQKELGLSDDQVVIKWNIPEDEKAYDAAVDLADQGCDIIFANSFGHEDYMIQAAREYPDVQFCHATGYQAATTGLENMHNYFTAVYESRYVSGIVAGMKLNEMIEEGKITADQAKIGYVGAYSYAEVVSGYTSFFLGVRSVCESATMEVKYTGSWADQALEKEAAEALIADNCVLISQHADTTGAASACEAAGVPIVGYNVSMIETAPNYALTSASIDWAPYVTFAVKSVMDGTEIPTDWCKGYAEGADKITELNTACIAEGTEEAVKEAEEALKAGTLHVFDTSTWTVNGETITTTATEELEQDYHGLEYIKDGYFQESTLISAPAFAFRIDGITELNTAFGD